MRAPGYLLLAAVCAAGCSESRQTSTSVPADTGATAALPTAANSGPCSTRTLEPDLVARTEERLANYRRGKAALERLPPGVLARAIESNPIRTYFHVIRRANSGLASDGDIPEGVIDANLTMLNNSISGARGGASTPFRFVKAGFNRQLRPDWFVMSSGSDIEREAMHALKVGGPTTLNVYIVDVPGDCAKGYASMPQYYEAVPWQDGVVLDWSAVIAQSPGSLGLTLVHEVGHWLGLYHTFQGSCGGDGDFVADTAQHSAPTCSQGACTARPSLVCSQPYPFSNYMNYHNDECMTEFTLGQAARMRDMYATFRETAPDDLITTGGSGWTTIPVALSLQDNNGNFDSPLPNAPEFADLAKGIFTSRLLGDYNNDGRTDVALLGGAGWTTIPLATFNADATVTFTNSTVADFPALSREINATRLVGDFNRDGRSDLALLGATGRTTLPVAFSNGNGTFNVTNLPASSFPTWAQQSGVWKLVGDWDGDGRSDIAITGGSGWTSVPVAQSNGSGTFEIFNKVIGDFGSWSATAGVVKLVGDFDGDGRSDIAITGGSGWSSVPIAFGRGQGNWHITNTPIGNSFAHHATAPAASKLVGDFNGDGLSDIALTGNGGWSSIPVAYSRGTGEFDVRIHSSSQFATWASTANVARLVGDFNNDGKADIALTGASGWLTIPVAYSEGKDTTFRVTNQRADNFAISTAQSSNALKGTGTFRD